MTSTTTRSRTSPSTSRDGPVAARRTPATLALIGGLVLGATGLLVEVVSGVPGFPTVPPGPIILVAAAMFVAFSHRRWAPVTGLAAALFLAVGNVISGSGTTARLADPGDFGPFAGTAVFLLGLAIALVAGLAASRRALRRR